MKQRRGEPSVIVTRLNDTGQKRVDFISNAFRGPPPQPIKCKSQASVQKIAPTAISDLLDSVPDDVMMYILDMFSFAVDLLPIAYTNSRLYQLVQRTKQSESILLSSIISLPHGDVDVLEWSLHHARLRVYPRMSSHVRRDTTVKMMQWYAKRGCPPNLDTQRAAVCCGNIQVLAWTQEEIGNSGTDVWFQLMNATASDRKLMLPILFSRVRITDVIVTGAAERGLVDVIDFFQSKNCPMRSALKRLHRVPLDMLRWMTQHGYNVSGISLLNCLEGSREEDWMKMEETSTLDQMMTAAISHGHMDMMQWIVHKRKLSANKRWYVEALTLPPQKIFPILEWIYNMKVCPDDDICRETYRSALYALCWMIHHRTSPPLPSGNFYILQWIQDHMSMGGAIDYWSVYFEIGGGVDCLEWLEDNHLMPTGIGADILIGRTVSNGLPLEDLKWWLNRVVYPKTDVVKRALERGSRDVLRWMYDDGVVDLKTMGGGITREAVEGSVRMGRPEVLNWLRSIDMY
ncbi:hypothetical protein PROFUN_01988 [Planoprotostelium fungivorum]|uniref:F-box domain-containing protein n=1 Tax=Planoprotostelium fungivorum TaxID=1890364 RepID=A0A2P6NB17_9EUKA|nr:hypothetical protein PROFUN_01988 [Planoprotostelium fungivorum]